MNLLDKNDNIDVYFRTGCENSNLDLNKGKAWENLNKKRKNRKMTTFSIATSIVILLGVLSMPIFRSNQEVVIPNEAFKRKKLEEYERKMAGTYEETKICYDCNGYLLRIEKNQAPENQYIQKFY